MVVDHLRQQLRHEFAMHVGQAEVAALETIGQLRVVEAEQVQDGGVEVADVDSVVALKPNSSDSPRVRPGFTASLASHIEKQFG